MIEWETPDIQLSQKAANELEKPSESALENLWNLVKNLWQGDLRHQDLAKKEYIALWEETAMVF